MAQLSLPSPQGQQELRGPQGSGSFGWWEFGGARTIQRWRLLPLPGAAVGEGPCEWVVGDGMVGVGRQQGRWGDGRGMA